MILVPGKFIYLCTPTTGSRSTAKVLLEQCGGIQLSSSHHATRAELNKEAPIRSEPFYSVLRNPYDVIASKYWRQNRDREKDLPLGEFLVNFRFNAKYDQFGPIIATYQDYVDRYFLYERGLQDFFTQVGFPDVEVPKIGQVNEKLYRQRTNWRHLDHKYLYAIDKLFPRDVELYRRVSQELANG